VVSGKCAPVPFVADRLLRQFWRLAALVLGMLAVAGGDSVAANAELNPRFVLEDVRKLLKKKEGLPLDVRVKAGELHGYYAQGTAQVLWLRPERNRELVSALAGLTSIGVTNMDAGLARIDARKQALQSEDTSLLALVELTYSAQFIDAAQKLRLGRTELYRDKLHRRTAERFIHTDRLLALVAGGEPLTAILARLEPQTDDYQAIRAKLIAYVAIEKRGGWPSLTSGSDLKLGDRGPRVGDLRQRLATSGELPSAAGLSPDVFDQPLADAVKAFQRQHNIAPSGVVDRRTLLALNISVRDRVAQLTANLERWRWFADIPPGDLLVINTNASRMAVRRSGGGKEQVAIKVDRTCEQSPAFDSIIDHVDVAPPYTFPASLGGRYFLPVLQSRPETLDPSIVIYAEGALSGAKTVDWRSYSESNFPFQIGQTPGPSNLLGRFRLPMKDDAAVSIHARPTQEPKLPVPRNAWPSCVAIAGAAEKTVEFIASLGVKVPEAPDNLTSSRIDLPHAVPVIFHYGTVWLDTDGGVVFGPDPLGLDSDLFRKLSTFASS